MTKSTNSLIVESCPFCESSDVAVVSYERMAQVGRRKHNVVGLRRSECSHCGEIFVSASQHDYNVALIEYMGSSKQAFVSPGFIKKLREKFCLTQRNASKLFGAGTSSVGKWEAGQLPSGPAALLIQCALHVPGVVQFLAKLADVEVTEMAEGLQWRSAQEVPFGVPHRLTLIDVKNPRRDLDLDLDCMDSDFSVDELYGKAA